MNSTVPVNREHSVRPPHTPCCRSEHHFQKPWATEAPATLRSATCHLSISAGTHRYNAGRSPLHQCKEVLPKYLPKPRKPAAVATFQPFPILGPERSVRSEARRVGKECVSTCRSRGQTNQ